MTVHFDRRASNLESLWLRTVFLDSSSILATNYLKIESRTYLTSWTWAYDEPRNLHRKPRFTVWRCKEQADQNITEMSTSHQIKNRQKMLDSLKISHPAQRLVVFEPEFRTDLNYRLSDSPVRHRISVVRISLVLCISLNVIISVDCGRISQFEDIYRS